MKCSCGAEIPIGVNFCGKCGRPVTAPAKVYCGKCGAPLYPGAKFCGKCGAPSEIPRESPYPVTHCAQCGKTFLGTGSLCDACKASAAGGPTWVGTIKEKAASARKYTDGIVTDKKRAKQLLIVALIVGLCIAFTGLAGKFAMGRFSTYLKNTDFFSGIDSELGGVVYRTVEKTITKLAVSLIKNDSSGFVNTMNQIINIAGSMAGDPYGINGFGPMIFSPLAQEAFAEGRKELIQEAGVYWPLLQAVAYYRELIIVGLIIAFVSAILFFLLNGKISDVTALRMTPALYIGAGYLVIVIVMTIMGVHALR